MKKKHLSTKMTQKIDFREEKKKSKSLKKLLYVPESLQARQA